MENNGLLITFLIADLAVLVFTGVVIVACFPKRIRRAIQKNRQRLDGTFSKRRSDTEQIQFVGFVCSFLTVVFVLLLFVNAATFFIHKQIVPLPLATEAIGHFHWNSDRWKAELFDPSKGNVAQRMEAWQAGSSPNAKVDLVTLVATWPTFLIGGILVSIIGIGALGRTYLSALRNYEADVRNRYREYFALDMQTRHQLVECTSSS